VPFNNTKRTENNSLQPTDQSSQHSILAPQLLSMDREGKRNSGISIDLCLSVLDADHQGSHHLPGSPLDMSVSQTSPNPDSPSCCSLVHSYGASPSNSKQVSPLKLFRCPIMKCKRQFQEEQDLKIHFSVKHAEKFADYPGMNSFGKNVFFGCYGVSPKKRRTRQASGVPDNDSKRSKMSYVFQTQPMKSHRKVTVPVNYVFQFTVAPPKNTSLVENAIVIDDLPKVPTAKRQLNFGDLKEERSTSEDWPLYNSSTTTTTTSTSVCVPPGTNRNSLQFLVN